MRRQCLAVILALLLSGMAEESMAADPGARIKKGNRFLAENKAVDALCAYNDAQLIDPSRPEIFFNIGNALYRQKRYSEAADAYRQAATRSGAAIGAKARYNTGNCFFQEGRYEEAIGEYRGALELDAADEDAKYNLEYAQRVMKEMLSKAKDSAERSQAAGKEKKESQGSPGQGSDNDQAKESDEAKALRAQKEKNDATGGKKDDAASSAKDSESGQAPDEDAGSIDAEEARRYLAAMEKNENDLMPPAVNADSRRSDEVDKDW